MSRQALLLLLITLLIGYYGFQERARWQPILQSLSSTPPATGKSSAPVPVKVLTLAARNFPVQLETLATVESPASVTIKSRIDGQLLQAWFVEGKAVRKGDRLFTLDDRPFVAQLQQAKANLAKDQAQLDKAQQDLKRYTDLVKQDVTSKGQWESYQAAVATLSATVEADKALVEQARLQLAFATIDSPLDGVAGALLTHPGNLVKNNENPLVTIQQIQPIDVRFAVAEKYLTPLRQRLQQGATPVAIRLPDSDSILAEGTLSFINNMVDASSGTLLVKARTDNRSGTLLPGQYVRVAVTLQTLEQALVVPSAAIQQGQQGFFVFVIDQEEKASNRTVTVLASHKGESALSGQLQVGDRVVIDGHVRLFSGAKVLVRDADKP
ncbi:efflux RND transporter periplasmic adaptor subunit [Candidatus Magnetaquicoccus inordinatus]|uniref:efflux RND transporter periplasmic adaptor subunit n=1 Tax=Candidatus Magnetaquicoccus inordinatus TaxID=2496818 RepID=UPI00102BAA91|nr:efflux RND transporter periplasmic adaptor subunit [Candidatus Magnetaquicoccus inordinatus]